MLLKIDDATRLPNVYSLNSRYRENTRIYEPCTQPMPFKIQMRENVTEEYIVVKVLNLMSLIMSSKYPFSVDTS